MPVHDWTRVPAGIFHHFHAGWVYHMTEALNRGLLPPGYYALEEQVAAGVGPDVLTLQSLGPGDHRAMETPGGVALAAAPPRVRYRTRAELDIYASKAKSAVIRHISDHQVIAICEVVSPGNKNSRHGLRAFVEKAAGLLRAGIHLLVLDLFPAERRDPQGIHKAIWDEIIDNDFTLPADTPLTLASYVGGPIPEAFVEPTSVGSVLPDMPLFLTPEIYVPVPLEATYRSAWKAVPSYWSDVLSTPVAPGNPGDPSERPQS
jgi:Protein of unknown function (DUF4058)